MELTAIKFAIRRSRHIPMSSLRTIIPTEFLKYVDEFSRMKSTLNGGKPKKMTCFFSHPRLPPSHILATNWAATVWVGVLGDEDFKTELQLSWIVYRNEQFPKGV
jgi:hypothetical protein